jgi:hypothetical protein
LTKEFEGEHALAKKAKSDHTRAEKDLKQAKALQSSTADSLMKLDTEISSIIRDIEDCQRDFQEQFASIGMTYDALPVAFQVQVCSSKPVSTSKWIMDRDNLSTKQRSERAKGCCQIDLAATRGCVQFSEAN